MADEEDRSQVSRPGESGNQGGPPLESRSDRDGQEAQGQGEADWQQFAPVAVPAPPPPGPRFPPPTAPQPPGPRFSRAGRPTFSGGAGTRRRTGPAEDLREPWYRRLLRVFGFR